MKDLARVGCVLIAVAALALSGCDPQKASWGLQAIEHLQTPADPPLQCGVALPADTFATARAGCMFTAGAMPADTLGVTASLAEQIPVRHVIVMMKENRSFDHLLGQISSEGQPGADTAPPTYSNPDLDGSSVTPFHAATTCIPDDPGHQSAQVEECIDGGKMDGFVRSAAQTTGTDGHFAMSYYTQADLPFDHFLARTFALGDRDFAPMDTGTYANRDFLLLGTDFGIVDTGISYPAPNTPSIMQLLMNAGYTWGAYTDDQPFSGALDWSAGDPGVYTIDDLLNALDNGTLPNVAFVDGKESVEDDHPDADLQAGEAWSRMIYQHAVNSPQWMRLAIVWTYDEAGGFADHVPPGQACPANSIAPFTQRGPRIPLAVISPWARRGFVSHVVRDHTAITRLIETLFGLPALTARDANSDALLDMFDFSCGRDLSVAPAPAAGTGGCTDTSAIGSS